MLLLAPPAQALGVGGLIAGAIKYLDSYAPMLVLDGAPKRE